MTKTDYTFAPLVVGVQSCAVQLVPLPPFRRISGTQISTQPLFFPENTMPCLFLRAQVNAGPYIGVPSEAFLSRASTSCGPFEMSQVLRGADIVALRVQEACRDFKIDRIDHYKSPFLTLTFAADLKEVKTQYFEGIFRCFFRHDFKQVGEGEAWK